MISTDHKLDHRLRTTVISSCTTLKNLSSFPLTKFDMIYMDPPWCNKSVRRGSKYKTSTNDDIFSWIPFETLLSPSGYVSIWITNKKAIETFIRNHFEKLNLKYKGEWKWIKSGVNELQSDSCRILNGPFRPYQPDFTR